MRCPPTSVNTRGTIHLLTDLSDATSSVTLTGNSLTLILPELDSKTTATNAQRDALIAESLSATGRPSLLNNQGIGRLTYLQPDRKDLSRVEISTGGEAVFQGGSQTIAQGGQIAVVAMKRTTIDSGALLDVSGVQDVVMDMASNNLKINVRPFDMRDSAQNREGDGIRSTDVWIDVRDLVLMPSGTGGHVGDRYYTPGGLLEVGGHLGNTAHGIGEWTSVGGTININSAEIVVKDGAVLDVSGGSMRYAGGYMQSTRMMGSDGRMYDLGQAPAGVKMLSIGDAFVRNHDRWGEAYSEVYGRPLFSGGRSARWEDGYTVGRDAGVITLSAPTVLMQGQIMGRRDRRRTPDQRPAADQSFADRERHLQRDAEPSRRLRPAAERLASRGRALHRRGSGAEILTHDPDRHAVQQRGDHRRRRDRGGRRQAESGSDLCGHDQRRGASALCGLSAARSPSRTT